MRQTRGTTRRQNHTQNFLQDYGKMKDLYLNTVGALDIAHKVLIRELVKQQQGLWDQIYFEESLEQYFEETLAMEQGNQFALENIGNPTVRAIELGKKEHQLSDTIARLKRIDETKEHRGDTVNSFIKAMKDIECPLAPQPDVLKFSARSPRNAVRSFGLGVKSETLSTSEASTPR